MGRTEGVDTLAAAERRVREEERRVVRQADIVARLAPPRGHRASRAVRASEMSLRNVVPFARDVVI
jgi:hypothetical protein